MNKMSKKNKVRQIVRNLNIIDDTLFQKLAEDIGFCEEMISTILGQNVTIKKLVPQNSIKNLQGRSVILDALCILENGKECNVEVQKSNDDNHEKRVRYNASCITANITEPGIKFEKIPDVISIFISKFDMFGEGKSIYHVERVIRETGKICDNGFCEIYVNTKVKDGTDVSELMRIFVENDTYDFQKFPKTSKRKSQFKKEEGGEGKVCEAVENYGKECAKEAVMENAYNFFKNGVSYEIVKASINSLTEEELQEIYKKANGAK